MEHSLAKANSHVLSCCIINRKIVRLFIFPSKDGSDLLSAGHTVKPSAKWLFAHQDCKFK